MKFRAYNPEQAYLPPSVAEVLGEKHLCLFIRRAVERLDLRAFLADYAEEGQPGYHPALMVGVWLYAYALGITSSRRLEQRVREDLGFRYLAGGTQPDFWTLNEFRRRHPKALNDLFTQVLELARRAGLGRLGHMAIDSTRVKANASPDRVDSTEKLRAERAKIRRQIRHWQQACNAENPNERPGLELAEKERAQLEQALAEIPVRLEQLKKSGLKQRSRTDPEGRFLKERKGFVLGYTVTLAASEDHVIVPDSNLARVMNRGGRLKGRARDAAHRAMRRKLRSPAGRATYARRQGLIEPVFGVLKEQRGMRQFRRRGLEKVAVEIALATTAYNLTRIWNRAPEALGR
jgi:transposase